MSNGGQWYIVHQSRRDNGAGCCTLVIARSLPTSVHFMPFFRAYVVGEALQGYNDQVRLLLQDVSE
jgi:hypothetical protein